jgi:hypothetical protein
MSDIHGVKAVHIFAWIDRCKHGGTVDRRRERQLHQNSVDVWICIELADER